MAGAALADVGDRFDGDLLGDDPGAVASEAAGEADAAVPAAVTDSRTVHLSFGDTDAGDYARGVAADQLIHAWDLAAAVGADRSLDPDVVAAVAQWYERNEPSYRSAGAVAPRPEVAGSDPGASLLIAFGRDPGWSAPV
jgi:hypothetical protein